MSEPSESPTTTTTTMTPSPLSSSSLSPSSSVPVVESQLLKDLAVSETAKSVGNELYAKKQYQQAIESYSTAIACCPVNELSFLVILYNNRAAAHLMNQQYQHVIDDCSTSLTLIPDQPNPKALLRRSCAFEHLDQFTEAQNDLTDLLKFDPNNRDALTAQQRITTAVQLKNERLQAEMMGKLKELGNSVLGKFGMSLDNFNAVKDPQTGSYNISFKK